METQPAVNAQHEQQQIVAPVAALTTTATQGDYQQPPQIQPPQRKQRAPRKKQQVDTQSVQIQPTAQNAPPSVDLSGSTAIPEGGIEKSGAEQIGSQNDPTRQETSSSSPDQQQRSQSEEVKGGDTINTTQQPEIRQAQLVVQQQKQIVQQKTKSIQKEQHPVNQRMQERLNQVRNNAQVGMQRLHHAMEKLAKWNRRFKTLNR